MVEVDLVGVGRGNARDGDPCAARWRVRMRELDRRELSAVRLQQRVAVLPQRNDMTGDSASAERVNSGDRRFVETGRRGNVEGVPPASRMEDLCVLM